MTDATPPPGDELPPELDISVPNAARMYDYMLGGYSNFEVDRVAADAMMSTAGSSLTPARENRSFLRRAVRFMAEQGVDQFLDLGSGIPTVGNVHEIAQSVNPDAHVVYVDNEPVAVAHAHHLLAGEEHRTTMIDADLRQPNDVLTHPETLRLLDFSRPVGILMVAIFHFVPDSDDPQSIVRRYRDAVCAGSYLALSHFTFNNMEAARRGAEYYNRTSTPVVGRSEDEVGALLSGVELVEPGLVWTPLWRPDSPGPSFEDAAESRIYAAVGRIG